MNTWKQAIDDFNRQMGAMSESERKEQTEKELERTKKDHDELVSALKEGKCSMCGYPITHFSKTKPCLHWLLKPKGFKSKYFPLLYEAQPYHQIEAYLRWVANTEVVARNINDLEEEKTDSKVIEQTIVYKNLEWSFSCSKGDMLGHKTRKNGNFPHYHFQMKVDGNVIISYGSFHIPFHDYDFFIFEMKSGSFPQMRYEHIHGSGMQKFFDTFSPEEMLDLMNAKHNKEGSEQFKLDTIICAEEGKTIPMEQIEALMKKREETGIPLAKLVQDVEGVSVQTIITPGKDIPEIAKRTPRNRGKKSK